MPISTPPEGRTKIVCTLGPASFSAERIRGLILEGADFFRINLSHGTRESHAETIARVREEAGSLERHVPLLLDLRGAKIRSTESDPDPFELRRGAELDLVGGDGPSTAGLLQVSPAIALEGLEAGKRIRIDDGKIELAVIRREKGTWRCRVEVGGPVSSRRGVTLVDVPTPQLPGLTEKDIRDIEFGVRERVDFFALSFVRSAADVVACRREVARAGGDIPVIAKLEKPEALAQLDPILAESFGVMVARGDLGVEAPLEEVPVYQKRIIAAARRLRKPVITATQMLESMTEKPVPTRAEVSDVANAVFDGSDAVMLSGETSIGKYPIETVRMMARTVSAAESAILAERSARILSTAETTFADAVGAATCVAAESVGAKCIVVFTASGYTAALISGHRPAVPIYAFSAHEEVVRRLVIHWGVEPRLLERQPASIEDFLRVSERALLAERIVAAEDPIAVVAGLPLQEGGNTNLFKLHRVGELDGD